MVFEFESEASCRTAWDSHDDYDSHYDVVDKFSLLHQGEIMHLGYTIKLKQHSDTKSKKGGRNRHKRPRGARLLSLLCSLSLLHTIPRGLEAEAEMTTTHNMCTLQCKYIAIFEPLSCCAVADADADAYLWYCLCLCLCHHICCRMLCSLLWCSAVAVSHLLPPLLPPMHLLGL